MKDVVAILLVVFAAFAFARGDVKPLTIITLSGDKFENVAVTRVEADGLVISHSTGVTKILFSNLSEESRTQLGVDREKFDALQARHTAVDKARARKEQAANAEQQKVDARRARKLAALRRWASQNLIVATREDQLRAAMAAKFFKQRNGKRLSAAEFQFLDDQTKIAIILYLPEMLPTELLDE